MGRPTTLALANRRLTIWHFLPLVLLPEVVLANWAVYGTNFPRWVEMWTMAAALFAGCKWLTWRAADLSSVTMQQQLAYLFLWPGLDAESFFGQGKPAIAPKTGEWILAGLNLVLGVFLFWGVARCWPENWPLVRGWTGMTGFILMAHCGTFQLLSCAWRTAGVHARPLMDWPLRSRSVSEFWGKRWNTAFRDLSYKFLFSPLARRFGPRAGLAEGFIFSGVVHELAVTIPAGGGYGGPTLFFAWQGVAILFERLRTGRTLGLGRGWRGCAFAMLAIGLPAGIAFPPIFVQNIILPMMRAAGAL